MKYVLEDRRKNRANTSFAGRVVVWQEINYPFPHRVYCGDYSDRKEANAAIRHANKRGMFRSKGTSS